MTFAKRLWLAFRAARELGIAQTCHYAWYQLTLRTGLTERMSRKALERALNGARGVGFQPLFELPSAHSLRVVLGDQVGALLDEAEEICAGKMRVFGSQVMELRVPPKKADLWFTQIERSLNRSENEDFDLKMVWEAARFGWVYPLARAYRLQSQERYAERFWEEIESFLENHPPYTGFQWLSAQEVALRLIAWTFGFQVFRGASSSTEKRQQRLLEALAIHAARIPSTVHYAFAQNNNHLLSEAVGLMTAGWVLAEHPLARSWWQQGWNWFVSGLRRQIAEDGTYVQHSTNYHRLMLQLALWAHLLAVGRGEAFPEEITKRLAEAARWLKDCCEPRNGCVPNLGPNDGAYIQPLSQSPFEDFRPVIQSAYRAFVGEVAFGAGCWDEMSLWYGVWQGEPSAWEESRKTAAAVQSERFSTRPNSWVLLHSQDRSTWAALRCPRFFSRPPHADLLHVDLWWEGINLACDAGTYRYTALPPWDNSLSEAFYHNTITINSCNPMTRAGKFLWLDWAKTKILEWRMDSVRNEVMVGAEHNGYRSFGVRLRRWLTLQDDHRWVIQDELEPSRGKGQLSRHWIGLHWLIHPCNWQVFTEEEGWRLLLQLDARQICLRLRAPRQFRLCIVQAGRVVFGEGEERMVYGFRSPNYNLLQPALSVILEGQATLPTTLETIWDLPVKSTYQDEKA